MKPFEFGIAISLSINKHFLSVYNMSSIIPEAWDTRVNKVDKSPFPHKVFRHYLPLFI